MDTLHGFLYPQEVSVLATDSFFLTPYSQISPLNLACNVLLLFQFPFHLFSGWVWAGW